MGAFPGFCFIKLGIGIQTDGSYLGISYMEPALKGDEKATEMGILAYFSEGFGKEGRNE